VQRLCFSFELRPGSAPEYQRRHDQIWPELVAELKAAGLSNYSLFRLGDNNIVAYVECEPDARTSFGALAHAEANTRWSAWFEDLIVSLTDEDGNLYALEELWHLD
jgi:L-rhamnose mutarotase